MVAPYCSRTLAYSVASVRVPRAEPTRSAVVAVSASACQRPVSSVARARRAHRVTRPLPARLRGQVDRLELRLRGRPTVARPRRRLRGRRRAPGRGTARRPVRGRTPRRRWPPRHRRPRRSAASGSRSRRPPSPAARRGRRRRGRRPTRVRDRRPAWPRPPAAAAVQLVRRTSTAAPSALGATPFPRATAEFRRRTPRGSVACRTPAGRRPAR